MFAAPKTGRLQDKVAIVTGAGGGIGREYALLLARQGARVVVNDIGARDGASAQTVVDDIRAAGGVAMSNTDSATWGGAADIVGAAVDAYGGVDILINNATVTEFGQTKDYSEASWDLTNDVNLKGYFAMIRAVVPLMTARGGGVITNASSAAGYGIPVHAAYSSAKEGVIGLTRSVARELGRLDIRCNAIRPVASSGTGGSLEGRAGKWFALFERTIDDRIFAALTDMVSAPEKVTPQKVATVVVWLCTDAAKDVSGQIFEIHGDVINRIEDPRPVRTIYSPDGWDLDSLDQVAPASLTDGLRNRFALLDAPQLRDPKY